MRLSWKPLRGLLALGLGAVALAPAMVASEAQGRGPTCPSGMVSIEGAYCIDRWEGALVESTPRGLKPFSPYERPEGHSVRAVTRAGIVPQAYISRNEAQAACEASGKRLCSNDEWMKACRGRKPTLFPYGDERRAGYCNDAGLSPLQRLFAGSPNMYGYDTMNDPRLNQLPRTVARTGAYRRCTNGYGVFDMVGNLHEWTSDPDGTFRGGYYLDTHINGDGCEYRTVAHGPSYHDYSTGFRCCASPR